MCGGYTGEHEDQKVLMFDPPEGWRYGFPRPIPRECLESDEAFRKYLVECGYPDSMMDLAFKYSRYWEQSDDG